VLPVWAWIAVVLLALGAIGAATKKDPKSMPGEGSAVVTTRASATTTTATSAEPAPVEEAVTTTEQLTTSTTSTTLPPTTTTVAPQAYQGHDDDVVDVGTGNTRIVLHATHDGGRNFIVNALDSNLQLAGGAVNEIGAFDGTVIVNEFGSPNDVRYLQVNADGNWTLELLDISAVPVVGDTFSGAGKQVVLYNGGGGIFSLTHDGTRNFLVNAITADDHKGVVNEIGPYTGRTPLPAGPAIIAVNADGNWTFTKT
jgi:hypothetical protein